MTLLEFLAHNRREFAELVMEHLFLVVMSTGIAVLIGVPLGILLTRRPALSKPILGFANIMQTVTSLALFGFLIPLNLYLFHFKIVGGIGARTAIVARGHPELPVLRLLRLGPRVALIESAALPRRISHRGVVGGTEYRDGAGHGDLLRTRGVRRAGRGRFSVAPGRRAAGLRRPRGGHGVQRRFLHHRPVGGAGRSVGRSAGWFAVAALLSFFVLVAVTQFVLRMLA